MILRQGEYKIQDDGSVEVLSFNIAVCEKATEHSINY